MVSRLWGRVLLCNVIPHHCPADKEGAQQPPPSYSHRLVHRLASLTNPAPVLTTEAAKDPLDSLGALGALLRAHGIQEVISPRSALSDAQPWDPSSAVRSLVENRQEGPQLLSEHHLPLVATS